MTKTRSETKSIPYILKDINETKTILYIPKDTNDLINPFNPSMFENINLMINKYPEFDGDKKAKLDDRYNINTKNKEWVDSFKNINNLYIKRIRSVFESLQSDNYKVEKEQYIIDWRLAVGIGEASVYETSIKLHHIYGIPFIPASTFKGTIRSWVINNYFNGKEIDALKDDFFIYVFGSPKAFGSEELKEKKGHINFFDIYPVTCPIIEIDIINNHYSKYYQDGIDTSPPGDYYSPNLVNFLTVKNTAFEFSYGYDLNFSMESLEKTNFKENIKMNKSDKNEEGINYIINNWIEATLKYQGIGSKTSVGYGYFKKDKEGKEKRDIQETKEMEKIKKEKEAKKFEEETKNMTDLQVKMYKINLMKDTDDKYKKVLDFYSNEINIGNKEDEIKICEFLKNYIENTTLKLNFSKKTKKKIAEIETILKCEVKIKK